MISSIFRAPRLLSNSAVKLQVNLFSTQKILALNELTAVEGSRKPKRRVGRGIGSGRGKNSGNGHQKSSATPFGFEGGQTPLYKRLPKIGFNNYAARDLQHLNVSKIQEYIDTGRLVPKENNLINLRDLLECRLITNVKEGVKLLAKDKDLLTSKIHLEVSFASTEAIRAVERAGGTVTCVHFNRLSIRALTQPLKFDILPRRARPNPKIMDYYLDKDKSGYLSPEIQQRNLKLFGFVTSEEQCKEEHLKYMHMRRKYIQLEKSLRQEIESGKKQAGQAELSVSE